MLREKRHFIFWETGYSNLWERFFPLGIRPLIPWDLDPLSSGNRDKGNGTWETGHAILWDSDHLSFGNQEFGN